MGFWPAVWTMGNLGRAGYGATLEGMVSAPLSMHPPKITDTNVISGHIRMTAAMSGLHLIKHSTDNH